MNRLCLFCAAGLLLVALAVPDARAQTAPIIVQPGAPGEASRVVTPGEVAAPGGVRFTEADVQFVQGMIPHHAQALEMTALVPERSTSRELHLLAERIEVAQGDEIAWMQRWLRERGQGVPALDAHAHHGAHPMPGMLTPDEMNELAAATGPAFDRLFLHYMTRHHEGALTMVQSLLAAAGSAQSTEVYQFASDVDADQRADILRMRALMDTLEMPATPPLAPAKPHHH